MNRKILLRCVLPICLALAILAGVLIILFSGKSDDSTDQSIGRRPVGALPSLISDVLSVFRPETEIKSDGLSYPVSTIQVIPIVTDVEEESLLPVVGDRETLLKLLLDRGMLYDGSSQDFYNARNYDWDDMVVFDVPAPSPSSAPMSSPSSASAPPPSGASEPEMASAEVADSDSGVTYSQTNEQVAGVSEGDIVKTDGQYIYAMSASDNALRIIRADGSKMDVVSTIRYGDVYDSEFYLIGNDRLAIVGHQYIPMTMLPAPYEDVEYQSAGDDVIAPYYYDWSSHDFTALLIYDIADRTEPTEIRRISMDGWDVTTRVVGDIIYLVTNKNMWPIVYERADSQSILPYCLDTTTGEEYEPFAYDRIYYIPDADDYSYMLIGAVDVYTDDPFEPTAYLGAGSNLYMSQNAMYITKWRYGETSFDSNIQTDSRRVWRDMTDILRFSINGTSVAYTGMGTVEGTPINQYSMDEYDGYFRIATTDWSAGTYVTVLDASEMQTVGRTEPLAPGEYMRSTRFMGDIGYVVTFQNTDPLFTIDLSDPYNPIMLGELKIPGFSQYLHPIGDSLMLGIGRDTQEIYSRNSNGKETVIGFSDVGMKVSLFDVSDPFDPKEIDVLALGEGWAEVTENPRALMCDDSRNIYGFLLENWSNNKWPTQALLLSVANRRLSIATSLTTGEYAYMYESRLCFIGNTLYLVHGNGVDAYDYNSYEKMSGITF